MFDLHVPFFIPVWRRVIVTALLLGWAAFELITGAPAWALLFGAGGLYCLYGFFFAWDEAAAEAKRPKAHDD